MKRYETSEISDNDKIWMLEKMGEVVEIIGGNARVIMRRHEGRKRVIEIPTAFWRELKEAE